jgi:hypothetical protein
MTEVGFSEGHGKQQRQLHGPAGEGAVMASTRLGASVNWNGRGSGVRTRISEPGSE